MGGWVGRARKAGGLQRKPFFFFFLLVVAGGSNSDLKYTGVMRHFIENAKNGFRRAYRGLIVK